MAEDHNRTTNSENTRYTIASADIELLRETGVSDDDITHCVKVAGIAKTIIKYAAFYPSSRIPKGRLLF